MRRTLISLLSAGVLVVAAAACSDDSSSSDGAAASEAAASDAAPSTSAAPTGPVDISSVDDFAALQPGTYFIDPDGDPSTPLRVVYDVPGNNWFQWIGAGKDVPNGHLGVSITTVENVTTQACTDHVPADPAVGPTVDDLATALSTLAPFEVSAPPSEVAAYGYEGQHLELTLPELELASSGDEFADCVDGNLASWITHGDDAFYGYSLDAGSTEEFWILDVDGTRLMISALRAAGGSAQDLAELDGILDSIQIEP